MADVAAVDVATVAAVVVPAARSAVACSAVLLARSTRQAAQRTALPTVGEARCDHTVR